jgi:DNA recombination protein RmuC
LKFKAKEDVLMTEKENQAILMQKFQESMELAVKNLKEESKTITSAIVNDSRDEAIKQSKEMIGNLITPLGENIKEFKDKFSKNEESIKNLSFYTDKLAKIFQNNIKNQGRWGEEIVEKILQIVGLKEGIDYTREATNQDGNRPDFIVNLPNENHIVIDAKVSFTNWEKFVESKEANRSEDETNANLKEFLKDIEIQMINLSKKGYENTSSVKNQKKSVLKYVLMFIPVEGMFAEIVNNSSLFDKALDKKIIIVSRASLMPALFLVKEIIEKQKQKENLEEIIKLAENVYERFRLILQNIELTEKAVFDCASQIDKAKDTLRLTTNRIRGETLIQDLKKMKTLGVQGKDLPKTFDISIEEREVKLIEAEEIRLQGDKIDKLL